MAKYMETHELRQIKQQKHEDYDDGAVDDDVEDDMKLFDLKQRLSLVKPKFEVMDANVCRCCSSEDACVGIYDQKDESGADLMHKLKAVCGVEVDPSDTLPSQICLNCLKELENAYKFRRKCLETDKVFRDQANKVKEETNQNYHPNDSNVTDNGQECIEFEIDTHFDDQPDEVLTTGILTESVKIQKPTIKRERKISKKNKVRKARYDYWKICEICGKNTRNLISHLESHSSDRIYSCEVCGKKFKFKSGLIIHKAAHATTPKKTCEVCGKNFYIMAQYRKHFAFHANERKFGCETCGKRFNSMDILKVHTRSHTDERPFSCSECGKTFRTSGCVSRHRRIVHRNIKVKKVEQKL
ncbi:jg6845 [Pararge aegeria aegeria]|uniref:Jg6845 protein n=5 Tax=Pararge aegeria TaxID=116150 RepID=A0A8S4S885_9NEOP|nr:jg6845 [Pararge aegeria aegeria]